jgi:hypothetical protein
MGCRSQDRSGARNSTVANDTSGDARWLGVEIGSPSGLCVSLLCASLFLVGGRGALDLEEEVGDWREDALLRAVAQKEIRVRDRLVGIAHQQEALRLGADDVVRVT